MVIRGVISKVNFTYDPYFGPVLGTFRPTANYPYRGFGTWGFEGFLL